MLTLDVGCGDRPKGDVNVDLFVGHTPHIRRTHFINPKAIKNFIRADGCFLPFRDGVFDVALSFDLIEHVDYPSMLLAEMVRVARKVVVRTPHPLRVKVTNRFLPKQKECFGRVHKHLFSVESLMRLVPAGCFFHVRPSPFLVPFDLELEIHNLRGPRP